MADIVAPCDPDAAVSRSPQCNQEGEEEVPSSFRETLRFKVWRKHVRDIYQLMTAFEPPWPSKTVQLMPYSKTGINDGRIEQTIICGTATNGAEQNYIKLLTVCTPGSHPQEASSHQYDNDTRDVGGCGAAPFYLSMKVEMRMFHEGDVLKARYMPHNPNIIATSSSNGSAYLFDRSAISMLKAPNKPARPMCPPPPLEPDDSISDQKMKENFIVKQHEFNETFEAMERWDKRKGQSQHSLVLTGNSGEVWALDWSPIDAGRICAGSNGRVARWDVQELRRSQVNEGSPALESHTTSQHRDDSTVNDLKWSKRDSDVVYYIAEKDGCFLRDWRAPAPTRLVAASTVATMVSLDICPLNQRLALGCGDGNAFIYDLRNVGSSSWATLMNHQPDTEVSTVQWCPQDNGNIIATGGEDGNVVLSDLARSSDRQTLFVHTGHTSSVYDVCWSWHERFAGQLVSTDDSLITAWKPRNRFFFDDDDAGEEAQQDH